MSSATNPSNSLTRLAVVALLLVLLAPRAGAHDVPNEVTVFGFVRPQAQTLTVLLRVPLKSLRDLDIPTYTTGFLDFSRVDRALTDATNLWIRDYVEIYENGQRLASPAIRALRVSLPGDRSFDAYDTALENIQTGPRLGQETQIYWEQGMLDVALDYAIGSEQSDFAVRPGLSRLGLQVNVVLRFQQPGKPERAFDIHADTGIVHLDPRWHQAFYLFAREGFFHILDGTDHLLFLLCLVIPFRHLRGLVIVVTSFTIAHSVTLIASAYGMAPDGLWFAPLIETLIAVSIVYMAFENIVGARLSRRWMVTFGFGLIHGFGFSFLLRERMQFAGEHLVASLLAFNVGVEIGQVFVLILAVPLLTLTFRYVIAERIGTILLSALVAHTAWHWATERGSVLIGYRWPQFTAADLSQLLRLAMVIVGAAFVMWLLSLWMGKNAEAPSSAPQAPQAP
ncbi:MAG: HupE/UreJ family protein [Acidobacteriota bacterium]|nr:HupE/UreJ family protein [Acidobacteriota bacterium]